MLEIDGRTFDIVTLDFETFYDVGYTLTAMSTSEYVRDPRFLVQMVGIKINDGPTQVYSDDLSIKIALRAVNWKRAALLCHNTAFDGFILRERYKIKPAFYLDTLGMARGCLGHNLPHRLDVVGQALGLGGKQGADSLKDAKGKRVLPPELLERMAAYCARDVDLTYKVYEAMYPFFPDEELELVDITLRMFCDPVLLLDEELAHEELNEEIAGKMRAVMVSGVPASDLMSNEKFAEVLRQRGVTPPQKISKTTGKSTYAFAKTDAGFQKLLRHADPKIAALAKARLSTKSTIGQTRAERFIEAGRDGRKVPVLLHYYGAHTGRWSGGNKMNMQNLPRQGYLPDGKTPDPATGRLRRALLAPKGKVLVVADSGQIEARVNAWLAGQEDMVKVFRDYDAKRGPDAYRVMAAELFGVPIAEVTKDQRQIGKICILALGYGMGANKFYDTLVNIFGLSVTDEQVAEWVEVYRRVNHCIPRFWKHVQGLIPRMKMSTTQIEVGPVTFMHEAIRLPNGMFLRYPELEISPGRWEGSFGDASFAGRNGQRTKLYGGLLTENLVQALARIIVADQMREIAQLGYRPVMTTHDEIVVLATHKQADKCLERMIKIMSTAPDWAPGLPLAAEGGWAENYSK